MLRILLSTCAMLAACASSPQKAAMPNFSNSPGPSVNDHRIATPERGASPEARSSAPKAVPEPVTSVTGGGSVSLPDSAAEAQGRLILSTAFVRVGGDGRLTVELRNGQVIVLRNVTMQPKTYCGAHVGGDPVRNKYCGGYAEIAAARPGGTPSSAEPDSTARGPIAARE